MRLGTAVVLLGSMLLPSYANAEWNWRSPLDFSGVFGDSVTPIVILIPPIVTIGILMAHPDPGAKKLRSKIGDRLWYAESRGAYFQSYHEDHTDVFQGSLGLGRFFRPWFSMGMDISATAFRDPRLHIGGVGGGLFFRWHFLRRQRWDLFYEQAIGLIFTSDEFPPGGTSVNFSPAYGIGVRHQILDRAMLVLSLRHFHVSNGGIFGDTNPGFDSNGIYVGYDFSF